MAINLATRYPGRANPADTNYPQGSFKNRSAPGVLDGSYLEKDWANDMFAFFQQALVEAGISPNDDVDNATNSQYYAALKAVFAAKNDFLSITTTAFEASVTDGDAVYWDSANSRFDEAIADGTNKQNMIGFADVTNSRVVLMGAYAGQLSGLTAGAKYYLSTTVAGGITSTLPASNAVKIGIAKTATQVFIDIDATGDNGPATETTLGTVEKATAVEAANFTADKFIDGARLRDAFNTTGNAPFFPCRAWMNANGMGTISIRASGNVSSFVDNGTGDYTVNFGTALPIADYSVTFGWVDQTNGNTSVRIAGSATTTTLKTVSALRISSGGPSAGAFDLNQVNIQVVC
jgi:roadblock/LC7 domain-containing protein